MAVIGGTQEQQQRSPSLVEMVGAMMANRQKPTVSQPQIYPGSSQVPGIGGGSSKPDNPIAEAIMEGMERGAENTEWRKRQAIIKQDDYERQDRQLKLERDEQARLKGISETANASNAYAQVNVAAMMEQADAMRQSLEQMAASGADPATIQAKYDELMVQFNKLMPTAEGADAAEEQALAPYKSTFEGIKDDPRVTQALKLAEDKYTGEEGLPPALRVGMARGALMSEMLAMQLSSTKSVAQKNRIMTSVAKGLMDLEAKTTQAREAANAISGVALGVPTFGLTDADGKINPSAEFVVNGQVEGFLKTLVGDPSGNPGPLIQKAMEINRDPNTSFAQKREQLNQIATEVLVQVSRSFAVNISDANMNHAANIEDFIRNGGESYPPELREAYSTIVGAVGGSMQKLYESELVPKTGVAKSTARKFSNWFTGTGEGGVPNDVRQAVTGLMGSVVMVSRGLEAQNNLTVQANKVATRELREIVKNIREMAPNASVEQMEVVYQAAALRMKTISDEFNKQSFQGVDKKKLEAILGVDPESGMFLPLNQQPPLNSVEQKDRSKVNVSQSPAPTEELGMAMMSQPMDGNAPGPQELNPRAELLRPYAGMQQMSGEGLFQRDPTAARNTWLRDELGLAGQLGPNQDVPLPPDYVDRSGEKHIKKGFSTEQKSLKKEKNPLKKKTKEEKKEKKE